MEQQRKSDQDRLREVLGPAFASYEKLLSDECDPVIGRWLLEVREGNKQLASRKYSPGMHYLHRRDSYEVMLEGLSLKQARARLKQIDTAIAKLRLLGSPFDTAFPKRGASFASLLDQLQAHKQYIEERLAKIGPRAHPDIMEAITVIVSKVYESTGQYHDAEVSEVLDAAIGNPRPAGYPSFPTPESLRMWRSKQGLSDLG